MKYLPYDTFDIETQLSKEEAYLLVRRFISGNTSKYSGDIDESSFQIQRDIRYRNSFLPVIEGTFQTKKDKTLVSIKMRLNRFVIIFLIIWMSFASISFFFFLIQSWMYWKFNSFVLHPLGMIALGYLLTLISFKIESERSKIDLKQLFQ